MPSRVLNGAELHLAAKTYASDPCLTGRAGHEGDMVYQKVGGRGRGRKVGKRLEIISRRVGNEGNEGKWRKAEKGGGGGRERKI